MRIDPTARHYMNKNLLKKWRAHHRPKKSLSINMRAAFRSHIFCIGAFSPDTHHVQYYISMFASTHGHPPYSLNNCYCVFATEFSLDVPFFSSDFGVLFFRSFIGAESKVFHDVCYNNDFLHRIEVIFCSAVRN